MVRSHRAMAAEAAANGADAPTVFERQRDNTSPEVKDMQPLQYELDIPKLIDGQIHSLIHSLQSELRERALESGDPETLGLEYLTRLNGGEVDKPEVMGGRYVALGGLIKYNPKATRHQCVLYSVLMPGIDPYWAWEDHGTLMYSQSARVGDSRQSVALHVAVDGMTFIRHTMKHDGDRHVRISEEVWDCQWGEDGTGELQIVRSKNAPRNLPVPNH